MDVSSSIHSKKSQPFYVPVGYRAYGWTLPRFPGRCWEDYRKPRRSWQAKSAGHFERGPEEPSEPVPRAAFQVGCTLLGVRRALPSPGVCRKRLRQHLRVRHTAL